MKILDEIYQKNRQKLGRRELSIWRRKNNKNLVDAFFLILDKLNINQFVEVGAHKAEASRRFVLSGDRKAVAIEANPYTFERYTKKAKSNKIEVLNVGIGNENKKLNLVIPTNRGSLTPLNSSFLKRKTYVDSIDKLIEMKKLDSLDLGFRSNRNTALWIDVEGFGYEVLAGASNFLKFYSEVIFIEVETIPHWKTQKTLSVIVEELNRYDLIPILRDDENETQFNVIFIRKNLQSKLHTLMQEFVNDQINLKISKYQLLKFSSYVLKYRFKILVLKLFKIF
jgi:FkbM family methyltransferase